MCRPLGGNLGKWSVYMKSIVKSLPFRLLVGVVVGIALGLWAGGVSFGPQVMQVVLTIKELLGSIINFCVPLIVIGFIAPSITRLKQNASRMLLLALILAYGSSVMAALLSMSAGFAIIPALSIQSAAEGLNELPELLFNLEIAPIMSVMSALVFSVLLGLAATWAKAEVITKVLEEFQRVVLEMVVRVVIPILPFFIAGTFCGLAYEGSITRQLPVFLIVILIVMVGHYIWMAVLYGAAGLYSGSNPLGGGAALRPRLYHRRGHHVLRRHAGGGPAVRPQVQGAAPRHGGLRHPPVRQHPPVRLGAHRGVLCDDRVQGALRGAARPWAPWCCSASCWGCSPWAPPACPAGTVMASLGLIISVLGFDNTGTGLMMTIFALQDSFGTACNITGDGALTLMLTGYAKSTASKRWRPPTSCNRDKKRAFRTIRAGGALFLRISAYFQEKGEKSEKNHGMDKWAEYGIIYGDFLPREPSSGKIP